MASRTIRCFKTLSRLLLSSSKSHLYNLKTPPPPLLNSFFSTQLQNPTPSNLLLLPHIRHFTSHDSEDEEEGETDDDEEEEEEEEDEDGLITKVDINRTYSLEEMKEEAAAIGYKVIGPLDPTERPFKYREPFFAVIQIGSHQFKVSNGDTIYTEKLKFCEVNDKLILDKVLMVGSKSQTIIGRPILPDAAVHAVVEEHALDAKVIIFKKKRRKNYRRTKGHRQELTRLRITDIEGIEKPEKVEKPDKVEKPGRVAVTA